MNKWKVLVRFGLCLFDVAIFCPVRFSYRMPAVPIFSLSAWSVNSNIAGCVQEPELVNSRHCWVILFLCGGC